jgi:hypothetical protein
MQKGIQLKILIGACISFLLFHTAAHAVSIEELSKTVVFLRQQMQETQMKGGKIYEVWYRDPDTKEFTPKLSAMSGTGLIFRYNNRDYLLTAKHVATALPLSAEIILNHTDGKSRSLTFDWLSKQDIIKGARWFNHPKVDMSVHPMAYPWPTDILSIPEGLFPKKDTDMPLLTPAYIVGFPMGQGSLEKLIPIAKGTQIASRATSIDIPTISPDIHYILLDQALAQGYSGAPVFYIEDIMSGVKIGDQPMKGGERLHFIGIQSSVLPDQTGGKISLVVPISYVWDILESEDFRTYEKGLESKR